MTPNSHDQRRGSATLRIGAGVLALLDGVPAGWALLAPGSFWRDFPLPGTGWVSSLPPYNEHLLTDFGAALLAVGVALALAAVFGGVRSLQVALTAALVQALPHLLFHLAHGGLLGHDQRVLSVLALVLPIVLAAALLLHSALARPRTTTTAD